MEIRLKTKLSTQILRITTFCFLWHVDILRFNSLAAGLQYIRTWILA